MKQNRYKYFRWTKHTATVTFLAVIVVPGICGYLGYKTDVSTPWSGGRRGQIRAESDVGHPADLDCARAFGICGRSGEAISFPSAKRVDGDGGKEVYGIVHRLRDTRPRGGAVTNYTNISRTKTVMMLSHFCWP